MPYLDTKIMTKKTDHRQKISKTRQLSKFTFGKYSKSRNVAMQSVEMEISLSIRKVW